MEALRENAGLLFFPPTSNFRPPDLITRSIVFRLRVDYGIPLKAPFLTIPCGISSRVEETFSWSEVLKTLYKS
jgi:hypothetical protein